MIWSKMYWSQFWCGCWRICWTMSPSWWCCRRRLRSSMWLACLARPVCPVDLSSDDLAWAFDRAVLRALLFRACWRLSVCPNRICCFDSYLTGDRPQPPFRPASCAAIARAACVLPLHSTPPSMLIVDRPMASNRPNRLFFSIGL